MTDTQYSLYDPKGKIERVQVPVGSLIIVEHLMNQREFDKPGTNFIYWQLDDFGEKCVRDAFSDFNLDVIRIHRFGPSHRAVYHFDSAFPNQDALIIRLDDNGDSRLKIEGELVPEMKGMGYKLPPGTVHEVIKGDYTRYTLVAWGIRK